MMARAKVNGDGIIELDDAWIRSVKDRLKSSNGRRWRNEHFTIFRVPPNIRKGDNTAYEPKIISFGPYHRGKEELKSMEEHKWLYLHKFLDRNPDRILDDYLREMKTSEDRARSCYSEEVHMGSEEFIEMMLLDGCLTIELLLMQMEKLKGDYPIVGTAWVLPLIAFDMLRLENQVPFFVLKSLFHLAISPEKNGCALIELLVRFFSKLSPCKMRVPSKELIPEFHHLLHFFHSCILPTSKQQHDVQKQQTDWYINPLTYLNFGTIERFVWAPINTIDAEESAWIIFPTATELQDAGIEFKRKRHNSFLDVTFRDGLMEMSPIRLHDHTNSLFRNLIAFEQCYPKSGMHVAAYASFMDSLIGTPADLRLLHQRGILMNGLGSDEEAVHLFNLLCKEIVIDPEENYLKDLVRDVKRHGSYGWAKWQVKIVRDCFSNPLLIFSLALAVGWGFEWLQLIRARLMSRNDRYNKRRQQH